jgi:catechol 2,3-dioxygenase-like lactoylglutathione lyase family enzyme
MPIKFENVGIAVRDIEEAIAFFTDLGPYTRRRTATAASSRPERDPRHAGPRAEQELTARVLAAQQIGTSTAG